MTTQITGLRIINNVITVTSHIPGAPTPDPGTPTPDPGAPTPKPGTPTCAPTVAPKPSPAIQSDTCLIQEGHYCIATTEGTKMGVSDATCQNTCRPGHQPWWPCNVGYCKDTTTKPTPDPANLLDAPTGWSNDPAVIEYTCDAPGQDCINACCAVGKGCDPCGVDENMDGSCGSIGFMKENDYQLTPKNIDEYMKFSCKLPKAATFSNGTAISENYSKYIWDDVTDGNKARNWCHGNNMHFDLSIQDPIQSKNLVRYRPVSCKDHGWTKELATKIGQDGTGCRSAGSDDKDQQKFIDMYNEKTWAGWATTTYVGTDPQFCGGNIPHMNKAGMWKDDDGNPTSEEWVKTRLGAIPWVNICDKYGGSKVGYKKKYGSIQGLCWEIQELDGGMDILDSLQKSDGGRCDQTIPNNKCKSLSELKLVDKTKNQTYVIQAGTGCGGNCHAATIKDPFSGESKLVKATNYCPSDVNTCGCTPIGEGTTGGTSSKKCFYPPPPKDDKNTDSTTIPETINGKSKKFTVFDIVKGPDILDIAYNNLDLEAGSGKNCGGWGMGISKQDLDSPTNRNMTFNGFFQNCGLKYPPSNWPSKIVPGQNKNNYITIGGAMIWAYSKDFHNEMPKIDRLFKSTVMTGGYNCTSNGSSTVVTYGCTASVSKKTPPTLTCGFGLQDYYAGVDFDLEDGLLQLCYPNPGQPDWNPLIDYCNKIKKEGKKEGKKIQWTVSGNGSSKVKAATPGEYNLNTISINIPIQDIQLAITKNGGETPFDTLSLMLYGGSMGTCDPTGGDAAPFGDWGLPQRYWIDSGAITNTVNDFQNATKNTFTNTLGYLWEWYNAIKTTKLNMSHSQINLGMSSINCTAGMVQLYTELCNTIGFAGILVWTISDTSSASSECSSTKYIRCNIKYDGCCSKYDENQPDNKYCNMTKCITSTECKEDGNKCPGCPENTWVQCSYWDAKNNPCCTTVPSDKYKPDEWCNGAECKEYNPTTPTGKCLCETNCEDTCTGGSCSTSQTELSCNNISKWGCKWYPDNQQCTLSN